MRLSIVLAHTVDDEGRLTREHLLRLSKGLRLYRSGVVDKILVTASHELTRGKVSKPFHQLSADWLEGKGVPAGDILRVPQARLTIEEAAYCRSIFDRLNPSEVHVVTSHYHLPRARVIFKKAYPHLNFSFHGAGSYEMPFSKGARAESPAKINRDARNMRRWRKAVTRSERLENKRKK